MEGNRAIINSAFIARSGEETANEALARRGRPRLLYLNSAPEFNLDEIAPPSPTTTTTLFYARSIRQRQGTTETGPGRDSVTGHYRNRVGRKGTPRSPPREGGRQGRQMKRDARNLRIPPPVRLATESGKSGEGDRARREKRRQPLAIHLASIDYRLLDKFANAPIPRAIRKLCERAAKSKSARARGVRLGEKREKQEKRNAPGYAC